MTSTSLDVSHRQVGEVARSIQRHALTLVHERLVPAGESTTLEREVLIDPTLASLPIAAVTTIADGGSCRPRALRIDNQTVTLEDDPALVWRRVIKGSPLHLGAAGTTCLVSLTIHNGGRDPSPFRGAILLGTWNDVASREECWSHSCRIPAGGGACPGCNYPRAFAHPATLLEAFQVDEIFVQGTAMQVYPDPGVDPALVWIEQRNGRRDVYPIPVPTEEISQVREVVELGLSRASTRQFQAGADDPVQAIGTRAQARLLERAAQLLCCSMGEEDPRRKLAHTLTAAVNGLASKHLDWKIEQALSKALSEDPTSIRTILQEVGYVGRAWRLRAAMPSGPHLVRHDKRPEAHQHVSCLSVGPLADPVSRIRIALLPQEAEHVRIYDLRVAGPTGPDRSVLHLIPGFGPQTVREDAPSSDIDGYPYRRYLPGSLLAGQLIGDVDLDQPWALPPDANILTDGRQVELDQPLPPMGRVSLLYQVEQGHLLLGVVDCQPRHDSPG
jgi:hypothetical protein